MLVLTLLLGVVVVWVGLTSRTVPLSAPSCSVPSAAAAAGVLSVLFTSCGLAAVADPSTVLLLRPCLSVTLFSPQLMMDNMMSRASDVYSFGIIMYELLTFRIPFDMLGKEQVRVCCAVTCCAVLGGGPAGCFFWQQQLRWVAAVGRRWIG
jgi:serine/threonine protein kinase